MLVVTSIIVGIWNVRTILDKGDRPERCTALIVRELDRYSVHIAVLSENRLVHEGHLTEMKGG